jgi:hypothetical protein
MGPVPGGLAGVGVDSGLDGLVELVLELDQTSPGNNRRYKTFFSSSPTLRRNKLECTSPANFSNKFLFVSKALFDRCGPNFFKIFSL